MQTTIDNIKDVLYPMRVPKKYWGFITDFLNGQVRVYKTLNYDINNLSVIIGCKKEGGYSVIRVLDKNTVIESNLDHSGRVLRHMNTVDENKYNVLLWITFTDSGRHIDVVKCRVMNICELSLRRSDKITYGVTDGEDVMSMIVDSYDVRGTAEGVVKQAIAYSFEKRYKKRDVKLRYFVVDYS